MSRGETYDIPSISDSIMRLTENDTSVVIFLTNPQPICTSNYQWVTLLTLDYHQQSKPSGSINAWSKDDMFITTQDGWQPKQFN